MTIYDVASRAGVSPGTVSKVLAERQHVSARTRALVLQAVSDLDYAPHATARNLSRRRTQILGLILPYGADYLFGDPFLLDCIRGIDDYAEAHDYYLLLCTAKPQATPTGPVGRLLPRGSVDGAVVLEAAASAALVPQLERQGYPWVTLGYPATQEGRIRNAIHADDYGGALAMTRHLHRLGHTRIGVISGPPHWMGALEARLAGVRLAQHEAGQPPDPALIAYGDFTPESGYQAAAQLLAARPAPTALFALNDRMALGAARLLAERGLHVPQDISLAGFDDIAAAAMANPPLATVRQPGFQMGIRAATVLAQLISGELAYFENIVLPTELVSRASAGPVPGAV